MELFRLFFQIVPVEIKALSECHNIYYTLRYFFLQVLIFADWSKTQNFVLTNLNYIMYNIIPKLILEFVHTLPYLHTNRK